MDAAHVTILLVEDDEGHAHLVQKNLRRHSISNKIIHLKDGQEALDYLFRQGEFRNRPEETAFLMLLDIRMPRIDGLEVLRRMKSDTRLRTVPVIMLTTTDDPREVNLSYELGCNAYVIKPVDYEKFVHVVRDLGLFLSIVHVPAQEE